MKKNIHFFDQGEANVKPQVLERIGIRGRLAMDLADLDLPILPGFIIDADVCSHLGDFDIWGALRPWMDRLAKLTGQDLRRRRQPHAGEDRHQPEPGHRLLPDPAQLRAHREDPAGVQPLRGRELRVARAAVPHPREPGNRDGHRRAGEQGERDKGAEAGASRSWTSS